MRVSNILGATALSCLVAAAASAADLTLDSAFSRATLPNQPVGAGYLTITNSSGEADKLISAESPDIAEHVEIHEMAMQDGVMKMRELPDGLEIPAGGSLELKPGGYHLMFMDLKGPLTEGETLTVKLNFENAGEMEVELPVAASKAEQAPSN